VLPLIVSVSVAGDSVGAPEKPPDDSKEAGGGEGGPLGGGKGDGSSPPPLPDILIPEEPDYPTIYDVNVTDEDAVIPSPLIVDDPHFVPPHPDLVVSDIQPSGSQVQNGTTVTLEAGIGNQGYEYLESTEVAFYVDGTNESDLLDEVTVSLEAWNGSASCEWNPESTGNHTIYVVADDGNSTWELNESNNMGVKVYEVVEDSITEGPNLVVQPENISAKKVVTTGNSTAVEVVVENDGDTAANNINVTVKEMPTETTVDEYVISTLGASSTHKKNITWNASGPGRLYLDVYVDVNSTVDESDEDDNIARNGFFVVNGTLNETEYDPPENTTAVDCFGYSIVILGDYVIPTGVTHSYVNCQIIVEGNVYVNGTLELNLSSLILSGSLPRTIDVQGHIDTIDSTITTWMWSIGFYFEVHGSIDMTSSNVFWTTGADDIDNPSGLQLYASNASFQEVLFSEGIHNGLWLSENVSLSSLTDSTFKSNGGAGIAVKANAYLSTDNATVRSNREGVRFKGSNGLVTNSSVVQNCGCGIKILEANGSVSIRNNPEISANGTVMCPERSGNFTIRTPPIPVIGALKVAGIYVRNSTAYVKNNTIADNWFGVQLVHETSTTILESAILNSDGAGILASAGGYNSTPSVHDSNISLNKVGIISEGSEPAVDDVDFLSNEIGVQGRSPGIISLNGSYFLNSRYAIHLINSSAQAAISNNTITRDSLSDYPSDYGLWMEDANPLVLKNNFTNLHLSAADTFCNSCGSTMTENRIDGGSVNHRFGIHIDQSSTAIVNGNNLTGYDAYDYDVRAVMAHDADSVTIEDNTFYHNVYSVFLTNSSANVTSNIFRAGEHQPVDTYPSTGGSSIYLWFCDNANITQNIINYSGYSIYLVRSSPSIEQNQILNHYYYPGYLYKDYNSTNGTSWDQIDRCAICVYNGSHPFIGNNTFTGNSYGISIESGWENISGHGVLFPCNPVIYNNTVSKTGYMAIATGEYKKFKDYNNVTIVQNRVLNSTGAGIRVTTKSWANITDNLVKATHGEVLMNETREDGKWNRTIRQRYGAIVVGFGTYATPFAGIGQYNVSFNNLQLGNLSGLVLNNNPVEHFVIEENEVTDFFIGIYDLKKATHNLTRNVVKQNMEGIRIYLEGNPLLIDNTIVGRGKTNESKGIAILGIRPFTPYTISTNNSVEDALIGIFVHMLAPHVSPSNNPVYLQGIDWVSNTTYGILLNHSGTYLSNVTLEMNIYGLYSINSSPSVDGWSSFSNNENGTYIYGTNTVYSGFPPEFEHVLFNENQYNGVIAYSVNGTGVYFEDVDIGNNGVRGLHATDSTIEMSKARILNNSVEGLEIINSKGIVEKSNVSKSEYGAHMRISDLDFTGNDFWNNRYSLYLHNDSISTIQKNNFTNPQIHDSGRHGVSLYQCSAGWGDVMIDNNRFLFTNYSVYSMQSGNLTENEPIVIQYNNISSNDAGRAIGIYQSEGYVTIKHNDLWNVTTGMYISSDHVTVEKNKVTIWGTTSRPMPRAIYSESEATIIGNNTLKSILRPPSMEHNGIRGVWKLAYNNTITRFTYGFRMDVATSKSDVVKNHIYNNSVGVRLYGSGVQPLIKLNNFTDNIDGLLVQGGASPKILKNDIMKLYGSTSYGIEISDGSPEIRENNITDIRLKGIWVKKGNPEIVQNSISNNKEGIGITSVGAPIVKNNTIEGNTDYGIYVSSNQSFHIEQSNDISNSTVGIFVGVSGNPTINSSNAIHHNDYGIRIEGGNASIRSSNSIYSNDCGIYLNTSYAPEIFDNNTITLNNNYGVYIHAANLTYTRIEWNSIENNTDGSGIDYGIYGATSSSPYWNCTCNWWGNNTGPYDPSPLPPGQNAGDGDRVSDYVRYENWIQIVGGQWNCTGS
jgi:parallel beta-helix repeat protein